MAFLTDTVTLDFRTPFQKLWAGFQTWYQVAGYSRAAAHLASQGYYEEAKNCMDQIAKLKS